MEITIPPLAPTVIAAIMRHAFTNEPIIYWSSYPIPGTAILGIMALKD